MNNPILSVRGVSRSFGGLKAVDQISFDVAEHEVFGVVGPNGAGKSTLFNLVAGVVPPSGGTIEAFGRRIDRLPTHQRCWLGIGRTFQAAQLFPTHTVQESLESSLQACRRGVAGWLSLGVPAEDARLVDDIIALTGLEQAVHLLPAALSNLQQQKLAIGMALATRARLLLLDEPSGGLIEPEVLELLAFIRQIARSGMTVVVIDHKMRLMMNLCDRILVMSAGQNIALGTPTQIAGDARVRDAYLGTSAAALTEESEVTA